MQVVSSASLYMYKKNSTVVIILSNIIAVPFSRRKHFVLHRVVAVQLFQVVADGSRAKEFIG
jgi:hypothetical protein